MAASFRDALAQALLEEGKQDKSIMVLTPDIARALRLDNFVETYPLQHISTGISELNTIGIASGLSSLGLKPIVAGFSMFVGIRPFEQIRNIVAYPNLNVKIFATHCGICVGRDGATHQTLEDLALMRTLPNFTVLTACDFDQTKAAVHASLAHIGPVYLRLGRDKATPVYHGNCEYKIGGSDVLKDGNDLAIFTMGTTTKYALDAAEELKIVGIDAAVINAYSIKPIDKQRILSYAKKCKRILTVEDHFMNGGLGSVIAEFLSRVNPVLMDFVGVNDTFGESGDEIELYQKYGLDTSMIVNKAKELLTR